MTNSNTPHNPRRAILRQFEVALLLASLVVAVLWFLSDDPAYERVVVLAQMLGSCLVLLQSSR